MMFKNFMMKAKAVLQSMGILKGIKDVLDIGTNITEETLERITYWRWWYYGTVNDFHDYFRNGIDGVRHKMKKKSLKAAKMVAAEMASLVFSEGVDVGIDHKDTDVFIKKVLKANNFTVEYPRFLEYMFAMGGMCIKVMPESLKIGDPNNTIVYNYVSSHAFIPITWNNNRITEAMFIEEFSHKRWCYTLLEIHEWKMIDGLKVYVISNKLYRSNSKAELGVQVSLSSFAQTAELEEVTEIKGLKQPLFVYTKPNTANNFDLHSPLGISLYGNSMDTLKAIDNAFDSFDREFRLGKKRIIVPTTMVQTVVDPADGKRKRYFDYDSEVFEAFDFDNEGSEEIKDVTTAIRAEEHIAGLNALLNILAMQTGFSPGTFVFDGKSGVKTATEVVSEDSKTFRSKKDHEVIIGQRLEDLIRVTIAVGILYKIGNFEQDTEISIKFSDSIIEDINAETDRAIKLIGSGLISKMTARKELLGMTEKEALEEAVKIAKENAIIADAEVTAMLGLNSPQGVDNSVDKPKDGESKEDFLKRAIAALIKMGFPADQADSMANEEWDESKAS